ncbi:MAG: hypothetical protein LKF61_03270 [Eggerthellaceae bacterium]|nr:hypothetical protein [Eggerthellaceae bacterium]
MDHQILAALFGVFLGLLIPEIHRLFDHSSLMTKLEIYDLYLKYMASSEASQSKAANDKNDFVKELNENIRKETSRYKLDSIVGKIVCTIVTIILIVLAAYIICSISH